MKPIGARDLKRRGPVKSVNKTVLIVCEGSKTEPGYLLDLVKDYGIHGHVEITGDCGSAPISVVDHAIALFKERGSYDHVYCVFDKDRHVTFDQAVAKVSASKLVKKEGKVVSTAKFEAITSTPCFEFWIMLHYSDAAPPMQGYSDLLPRLKRIAGHSKYEKGVRRLYAALSEFTDTAIRNSKRVEAASRASGSVNPLTRMHVLIEDLKILRNR
ncbi:RloB family protein [Stenotrophomonas sp.]|uniref:RloB family protein n=1 Tax=Stenotrophomonas sp. TaxID=69392 RepID=UPI0028A6F434|nr:RloB family protein [Stenotrophomonas sp.]